MKDTKGILLRDYQEDIRRRVVEAWRRHRSVMVQMPTGTGKTAVLAAIVNEEIGNEELRIKDEELRAKDGEPNAGSGAHGVWIVAHRRELVEQIEATVQKSLRTVHNPNVAEPSPISKLQTQNTPGAALTPNSKLQTRNPVSVYSIQWLSRHLGEIGERPRLVVIDEAHHALAETYKELWLRCPEAKFLGMTATPCRLSGRGFTDLFDALVCSGGVAGFIRDGWLSAFDYVSIRQGSDEQRVIDGLKRRGADGDFLVGEMEAALNRRPPIERLCESVQRYAGGRKGIVYAVSIAHARNIAAHYNARGISAAAIDSKTPAAGRARLVEDFRQGRVRVLVNVDVFSEGFDCPDVGFVQLARPTLSLAKYLQQVGRGLRRSEGKECCVIIDNVGLYRLFGLPTAARDWQAMFEGRLAGRGILPASPAAASMAVLPEEGGRIAGDDGGPLEVVVAHDKLMESLEKGGPLPGDETTATEALKPYKDRRSWLYGLRRGLTITVEARYRAVTDVKDGLAAVEFTDGSTGIVDGNGNALMAFGRHQHVRLRPDGIAVVANGTSTFYADIKANRLYYTKPAVVKFGDIELLKVGGTYYSRTKNTYKGPPGLNEFDIVARGFYLRIHDFRHAARLRSVENPATYQDTDSICILSGDDEDFYAFCGSLADGSIIVADKAGRYFHAEAGKAKRRIASEKPGGGSGDFKASVTRLKAEAGARAAEATAALRRKQERQRTDRLAAMQEAEPFKSGLKWGLRLGGRVIVPPIYRNIAAPVGNYCAFEGSPQQWGVIMLDGSVVVEARYASVEISEGGTASLTVIPGKTKTVDLGAAFKQKTQNR